MRATTGSTRLGLQENLAQFSLLVLINAFVGGMVGLERTVVPPILPAHASEPIAFDGQPIAASLGDVASWLSVWLGSESEFVERVTSNLPPTPPNFGRIVELNESGDAPGIDPTDLEAGANRCAVR